MKETLVRVAEPASCRPAVRADAEQRGQSTTWTHDRTAAGETPPSDLDVAPRRRCRRRSSTAIHALPDARALIEVVMDLGRRPEARFPRRRGRCSSSARSPRRDIQYVVDHIGSFGDDNRAGIERTLHRISAIRNRNGKIVGLTLPHRPRRLRDDRDHRRLRRDREVDPDHGPAGHRQDDDAARGRARPRRRPRQARRRRRHVQRDRRRRRHPASRRSAGRGGCRCARRRCSTR